MIIPLIISIWLGHRYFVADGGDGINGILYDINTLIDNIVTTITNYDKLLENETFINIIKFLGIMVAGLIIIYIVFVIIVNSMYEKLTKDNAVDISAFCQQKSLTLKNKFQLLFTQWMSGGYAHKQRLDPIPLGEINSTFMDNLKVSVLEGTENSVPNAITSSTTKTTRASKKPIVIGTIRMGFGHHRIAYAACSWDVNNKGTDTYFHDFLAIESKEAQLIRDMDKLYSKGSRLASEIGGIVESIWGSITLSGDADSLRGTYQMAEIIKPLLSGMPKDTPIIATHCLVGLTAVALGFTNVINLVIDNHAQWFIVVPNAINLVQGPTNYANLLKMGVPPEQIQLAGAWIPKDLVDNIRKDCAARIARRDANKPLRLLLPVGGAGAQRKFVCSLIKALKGLLDDNKVQLFLNAGDHEHMRTAFIDTLNDIKEEYDTVSDIKGVHDFCDNLRTGKEPSSKVTLFAFNDYFPAVATTDIVGRVTDVLACKPSELAFYPIPKLMIRRVGDHEQFSALRASELGDGTLEAREVSDALDYINLFLQDKSPLLKQFNTCIVDNNKIGLYDGCKKAVEIANSM